MNEKAKSEKIQAQILRDASRDTLGVAKRFIQCIPDNRLAAVGEAVRRADQIGVCVIQRAGGRIDLTNRPSVQVDIVRDHPAVQVVLRQQRAEPGILIQNRIPAARRFQ